MVVVGIERTWSLIWAAMVGVEFFRVTIPVSISAMGTDDDVLFIVETVCRRRKVCVGEVDTPVCRERDVVYIFESVVNVLDALHALDVCHIRPFEVQACT